MEHEELFALIGELNASISNGIEEAEDNLTESYFALMTPGWEENWMIEFPGIELCNGDYIPEHISRKSVLLGLSNHVEEMIQLLNIAKQAIVDAQEA